MSDQGKAIDPALPRPQLRRALIEARQAITDEARQEATARIVHYLDRALEEPLGNTPAPVIAGYWPIRGEVDLTGWLAAQIGNGLRAALPVVLAPDSPLIFRPWAPGCAMTRGRWDIPQPDTAEEVTPDIVLVPLVGWDARRYRIGYGGGFYDRTLAGLRPRPLVVGVGFDLARLERIEAQPHDIPMDVIVTESGQY